MKKKVPDKGMSASKNLFLKWMFPTTKFNHIYNCVFNPE